MIGTISPVVYEGEKRKMKWLAIFIVYLFCSTLSAGFTGSIIGTLGYYFLPDASQPFTLFTLGICSITFALHEIGVFQLRLPCHRWQVPGNWRIRFRPWKFSVLYGAILGAGLFTYIRSTTFFLAIFVTLLVADPVESAFIFAAYGVAQSLPPLIAGLKTESFEDAYQCSVKIHKYRRFAELSNGLLLTFIGIYFFLSAV